jgi:hypothetical protein
LEIKEKLYLSIEWEGDPVTGFDEFFRAATRIDEGPHGYQRRLVLGRRTRVNPQGLRSRVSPGEVLVVNAADGGYDPVTGFDPNAHGPVPGCPSLDPVADPAQGAEDGYAADSASVRQRDWMSLDQHSEQTRDQAKALLGMLRPALPGGPP